MLSNLRRRLNAEGGISLVETLVAVMILSISMLAMLNTFVASAHATLQQRMRSAQTRVATAELERLRSVAWTPTFPASPATVTPTTAPVVDGRTFTVSSQVTTPEAGLKHIITTVTCAACGGAQTLRTSVTSGKAAADTVVTNAFMTLALAPNPVRVYQNTCLPGYWCPGAPVAVTATVEGATYSGQLQLTWTGADGVPKTLTMSKSGSTWTGSIPQVDLLVNFADPADLETTQTFTLSAPGMPSLPQKQYTLSIIGYDDIALSLNVHNYGYSSDPVRKSQIRVDWHANNSCHTTSCRNMDNVVVWVSNVDPNATSVLLNWSQPVAQSLTLVRHSAPGVWYFSSANSGSTQRRWYPGPSGTTPYALPITVTVRRTVGATTTTLMQSVLNLPVWTAR